MNLRPMLMSDADFMLELKNDPQTREYAIVSKEEIKREDHLKWLEKNIQYFRIIISREEVVGAIRIQDNEVSIWIHPKFRGRTLARVILQASTKKGMKAKILCGNIASLRSFNRAHFLPEKLVDNMYYILKRWK